MKDPGWGGVVGAVLGAYLWIVVLGAAIGSPALIAVAAVLLVGTLVGGRRLVRRDPARRASAIGLLLVWAVLTNLVVLNVVWDRIPETAFGLGTGKSDPAFVGIHVGFVILAAVGLAMVVRDRRGS